MWQRLNMRTVVLSCVLVAIGLGLIALLSRLRLDDTPAHPIHKAQNDLEALAGLIDAFHTQNHRYPREDEGLSAVLKFGGDASSTASLERHPRDPWGHPYVYHTRDIGPPQLYSVGPNQVDEDGKGDDISVAVK
jgi:type II secretion system protein G